MNRNTSTLSGLLMVLAVSTGLLLAAGLTPTGNYQASDINANGHSITNAATVSATNIVTQTITLGTNAPASNWPTGGAVQSSTLGSGVAANLTHAGNAAGGFELYDSTLLKSGTIGTTQFDGLSTLKLVGPSIIQMTGGSTITDGGSVFTIALINGSSIDDALGASTVHLPPTSGGTLLLANGNGSALTGMTWSQIGSKPTTLSGYGITNGVANTVTVNGHALSSNVTVTPSDLSLVIGTNTEAWSAVLDKLAGNTTVTISNLTAGSASAVAWSGVSGTPTTLSGYGITNGVANTVTVNGHALSSNVVVSASDITTGTLPHGQLPALVSGDIPNNAANTTGNATHDGSGNTITTTYAPLASPALTGTPTAPTASAGNNSTQVATTAYVQQNAISPLVYFGDGSDGNVTVSSAVTLTRDMYYNNLTIGAGAALNTGSYRIFVAGTLDVSAAPAGGLQNNSPTAATAGGNGTSSSYGAAGAPGYNPNSGYFGGTVPAGAGGKGGYNNAANGATGAQGLSSVAYLSVGTSTAGGAGGAGNQAGYAGGAGGSPTTVTASFRRLDTDFHVNPVNYSTILSTGFGGSGGGGGGAPDNAAGAGGGGGGGGGGGAIIIFANTIARGANSTAAIFQVKGGAGANGGNGYAGSAHGAGGGGGGSGGCGGYVYIAYLTLTGSTIANAIDVSGGAGGAGGTGGTGTTAGGGGAGGGSGSGGVVMLINAASGVISNPQNNAAGTAGSAASGATGGAGVAANNQQANL